MTRPVGRIEVWEPGGGAALYTINDAVGIYCKEIITDGVGNFNFTVYSHKDFSGTYYYPNIDLGDTVKIWLDYDTIAGNPNYIGKVTKRSGPLLTETGWVRKIAGLSQGELLLRRFKKNKYYDAIGASTIVTEWANDLGLGAGDITADATAVTLEVRTKTYFDLLRWISDYWANAGVQIKKDFWVDLDGDLVWKVRPLRSAGVESLTTSDFLSDPLVEREVDSVKNDIVVYGEATKPKPSDKDSYTEPASSPPPGWSASSGTVDRDDSDPQVGTYSVRGSDNGTNTSTFKYDLPLINIRDINKLRFWHRINVAAPVSKVVRLHAPDNANRFETTMVGGVGAYTFNDLALGPDQVNHATENPNGIWTATGSPNWWNIEYIEFSVVWVDPNRTVDIDGLYFYPERWSSSASNAASKTSYGQRDMEVTDDKLHSDSDCQKRAETLLYQLKDPPVQITVTVRGNDNVLVGDRLTMTIPSEGITTQPYDVIAVENLLNLDNWTTTVTMVNSANWRAPLQLRQQVEMRRRIRELGVEEKGIR